MQFYSFNINMALIIEMKKSKFFSKKKFLNFLNFKFLKKKTHFTNKNIYIIAEKGGQ